MANVRSKFICFSGGVRNKPLPQLCVRLFGGDLGTMAKFGPLANIDSCTEVSGVLERLMTHFCFGVVGGIDACITGPGTCAAGCHYGCLGCGDCWCWSHGCCRSC